METILAEANRKIAWLEKRYSQMSKAVADTIAETMPLEQQQKFYLSLAKRLDKIQQNDFIKKPE